MPLPDWLKNVYDALEKQWYALVDWLQSAGVPVRKYYVDPLEARGIKSFPVTVAVIIILLLLLWWVFAAPAPPGPFKVFVYASGIEADGAEVQVYHGSELIDADLTIAGEVVFKKLPAERLLFKVRYKDYPLEQKTVDVSKTSSTKVFLTKPGELAGTPTPTARPRAPTPTIKPQLLCGAFGGGCCEGGDACVGQLQCMGGVCVEPTRCGPNATICLDRQVCCAEGGGYCGFAGENCTPAECVPPCNATQYCNATNVSAPFCWPAGNETTLGKKGGACRPGLEDPCDAGLQCIDGTCVDGERCGPANETVCEDFARCCGDGFCRWDCETVCEPPCGANQYCEPPSNSTLCQECTSDCKTCSPTCLSQACQEALIQSMVSSLTGSLQLLPEGEQGYLPFPGLQPVQAPAPSAFTLAPECSNCSNACAGCDPECPSCLSQCRDCDAGHCECGQLGEACCGFGVECSGELQCYDGKCSEPWFTKEVECTWDGKKFFCNVNEIILQVDPVFPVDAVPVTFNLTSTAKCPNPVILVKYAEVPGYAGSTACFNTDLTQAGVLMFTGDGYNGCPIYGTGNTFPNVDGRIMMEVSCLPENELGIPIKIRSVSREALVATPTALSGYYSAMLFYILNQNQIATKAITATPG